MQQGVDGRLKVVADWSPLFAGARLPVDPTRPTSTEERHCQERRCKDPWSFSHTSQTRERGNVLVVLAAEEVRVETAV